MTDEKQNIDPKTVGIRIRQIRQNLGYSMTDFANKIDEKARSGTVSNWETGKNLPNNSRLKRIAELGNVSMTYLLEGKYMLRDIHMMSKEEQENLWNQQKKQVDNVRLDFINATQSDWNEFDLKNLSSNELCQLNHFTNFIKNYKTITDNQFIDSMFATFTQLNKLYEEISDPRLSAEEKNKVIDLYINDLLAESDHYYKELAKDLKNYIN